MSVRRFLGPIAFIAFIGLAACSSGSQSVQIPNTANSAGNGAVAHRSTKQLRAVAAKCSTLIQLLDLALCTNIELAGGPTLGPTTPAAQVPGLHPADLQSAYALPSVSAGRGQTIGIVVAYADPNAESDLAVYRSTFGLPTCSSANGCLRILAGGSPDPNWARETVTDIEMASAICPNCNLVLAQAPTTNLSDLAAAVSAAVAAGATVVSNSYIIPEGSGESDAVWSHPGIPIVGATGDLGYGLAFWPAAATDSIAAGATTLVAEPGTSRGWTESVWYETGSACSTIAAKPAWQNDSGCSNRTLADVVAVGDPDTPVAVYNSYQDKGWVEVGGTSVSTPIIAGAYGLAANGTQLTGAESLYADPAGLFAITSGSNGICLSAWYLCNAGSGYSGPAGMGSPNGVAAF